MLVSDLLLVKKLKFHNIYQSHTSRVGPQDLNRDVRPHDFFKNVLIIIFNICFILLMYEIAILYRG
ncbi:hypothetical protein BpHYR1_033665 [Brachionus plicatilis]|uniref:Uncharacterized protein n=1 Tax=Brachionus plicatilis TaxID=10195 RepID=A0A3M7QQ83_BRAPC|nr:hypothetical protein BpHYR1_033665 [Brachionus plicatilis]